MIVSIPVRSLRLIVPLLLVAWSVEPVAAQNAVQLPTYSQFGTNTTVVVPDGGAAYMGGVKRAASGRAEFGVPLLPFGNRSIGTERSSVSTHAKVTIIDFDEMEEALLGTTTGGLPNGRTISGNVAPNRAGPAMVARSRQPSTAKGPNSSAEQPVQSVAALKARRQGELDRQRQRQQQEALQLARRGYQAEIGGDAEAARRCYRLAATRADGELKAKVLARMRLLDRAAAPLQLAADSAPPAR